MIDIIGSGFCRTGTWSTYNALELLGCGPVFHNFSFNEHKDLPHRILSHADNGRDSWADMLADYRVCLDAPCCLFWQELMEEFPDAKVLHTTRDPDAWFDSMSQTIFDVIGHSMTADVAAMPVTRMNRELLIHRTFDGRISDRAHCTDIFKRHEAEVIAQVPRDRLLVFDVREGWEPLCDFLGKPVPEENFPKTNDTAEFRRWLDMDG